VKALLILITILMACGPVWGANTHSVSSEAGERELWWGEQSGMHTVAGCTPAVPTTSLVIAAFACQGYVITTTAREKKFVTQAAAAITIADTPVTWVALHKDTFTSVPGWTRVALTHYLTQASLTDPGNPTDALTFARVAVAASIISAIDYNAPRVVSGIETISISQNYIRPGVIHVPRGGTLNITAGTLTACIKAGRYRIKTGAGLLAIGHVCQHDVSPYWFGVEDGVVSTAQMNEAIVATPDGGTLRLPVNAHIKIDGELSIECKQGMSIIGSRNAAFGDGGWNPISADNVGQEPHESVIEFSGPLFTGTMIAIRSSLNITLDGFYLDGVPTTIDFSGSSGPAYGVLFDEQVPVTGCTPDVNTSGGVIRNMIILNTSNGITDRFATSAAIWIAGFSPNNVEQVIMQNLETKWWRGAQVRIGGSGGGGNSFINVVENCRMSGGRQNFPTGSEIRIFELFNGSSIGVQNCLIDDFDVMLHGAPGQGTYLKFIRAEEAGQLVVTTGAGTTNNLLVQGVQVTDMDFIENGDGVVTIAGGVATIIGNVHSDNFGTCATCDRDLIFPFIGTGGQAKSITSIGNNYFSNLKLKEGCDTFNTCISMHDAVRGTANAAAIFTSTGFDVNFLRLGNDNYLSVYQNDDTTLRRVLGMDEANVLDIGDVQNIIAAVHHGSQRNEVDARTIADTGNASPATLTLVANVAEQVEITCNDVDTCDVTMSLSGTAQGQHLTIASLTANVVDFADTVGVSELAGPFAMTQFDVLRLVFFSGRWVEIGRSVN